MRKRKGARSEIEEEEGEAVQVQEHHNNGKIEREGCEGNGFFACYLLASLNPRFKGHTYIGFTVNPRRRIRQHNGEIGCGAWRTKKRRPWEMVLCIYGFPTNVSALQFEWAWQHPVESLAVRKAAVNFKSLSGIANKIKLAYTMLTLPSWENMNMTVHFFSTKYMKHCGGCPNLPEHMKVETGSMDELPCYTERIDGLSENEDDVEFENNASTSGSVPVASDDSLTLDSPKSPNHWDRISEAFGGSKESEAREPPGHPSTTENPSLSFGLITTTPVKSSPVASSKRVGTITENPSQSFGFITTTPVKSSPVTSSKRVEIIEDADLLNVMNKSDGELSQPESVKSDAVDVNSTFIVPHEAEIVDLSTPSPSWRNIIDRKKRRVSSSVGSNFIDLTKSPNFVQL